MGSAFSTSGQAAASPESSADVVERLSTCPVCFEKYTMHIIQCLSGHSVCEECSKRLEKCPQCTARYGRTRNFALEDILAELQRMNTTPEKAVEVLINAAEAEAIAQSIREAEAAEAEAIAQSIREAEAAEAARIAELERLAAEIARISAEAAEAQANAARNAEAARQAAIPPPRAENIVCRMQNCRRVMPINDLKEHLTQRHAQDAKILPSKPYLSKSYFNFDLHCNSHRFALITEIGIFFLVVHVEKQFYKMFRDDLFVTAWVQGTCKPEDAHLYYSFIQIDVKHIRAKYHDYVHGPKATVAEIEGNNECMRFAVNGSTFDALKIQGYVCLNKNSNNVRRRRDLTDIETISYNGNSSDSD